MEGGTKHVTLRRFEPYRPSCTNLTPTRATASGSALLAFFYPPPSPYLLQCLSGLGQGKPPGARGRGQQTVVLVAIARWGDMRAPTPAHGTHVHGTYAQGTYVRPLDVRIRTSKGRT